MSSTQNLDKTLSLIPYFASASSFYQFLAQSSTHKDKLFQQIRQCRADEIGCRFNVWRLLMAVLSLNNNIDAKILQIQAHRKDYKEKKADAFNGGSLNKKQVGSAKISKNPLMKAMMKVPSATEVDDPFLKDQIRKDVERTYQQMQFFQQEPIIKLLSSILFVWCKRNPDVSYKQGMNEVLASIVYVYFQQAYGSERVPRGFEQLTEQNKRKYILFNSIEFAEPDIYSVFEKVMDVQNQMYKTETDSNLKGVINPNSKNNTPILQRITNIIDHKLKSHDIELFRTIKLQNVITKTFLLKWIRCMHTREFTLQNSFLIWDSIFLEFYESTSPLKTQFDFIDSMCVAMFIYLRTSALTRQTSSEILQIYQKYPSLAKGECLEELISLAWKLSDSLKENNGSRAEWIEKESLKVDAKLQLLKPRQLPKTFEKEQQKIVKKQSENTVKQQNQAQMTQMTYPILEKGVERWQIPSLDLIVILQPTEWQTLVQKLKKSLSYQIHSEARKNIQQVIQILRSKVSSTNKE